MWSQTRAFPDHFDIVCQYMTECKRTMFNLRLCTKIVVMFLEKMVGYIWQNIHTLHYSNVWRLCRDTFCVAFSLGSSISVTSIHFILTNFKANYDCKNLIKCLLCYALDCPQLLPWILCALLKTNYHCMEIHWEKFQTWGLLNQTSGAGKCAQLIWTVQSSLSQGREHDKKHDKDKTPSST